jgi:hypothetical protein
MMVLEDELLFSQLLKFNECQKRDTFVNRKEK